MTLTDLEHDHIRQFALARAIEIVGEAANYVTDEFKAAHPQIAWKRITYLRNRLIHAYFKTDTDVRLDGGHGGVFQGLLPNCAGLFLLKTRLRPFGQSSMPSRSVP